MLDSEIAIMRQVCHPNIISLIAEQETTDQLFLVMELVKVEINKKKTLKLYHITFVCLFVFFKLFS